MEAAAFSPSAAIRHIARLVPSNLAVRHPNRQVTYGELEQMITAASHALAGLGFARGSALEFAITDPFLLLLLALAAGDAGLSWCAAGAPHPALSPAATITDKPGLTVLGRPVVAVDPQWFKGPPRPPLAAHTAAAHAPWFIARSSGATGAPKLVPLSAAMVASRALLQANAYGLPVTSGATVVASMPDYGFGLISHLCPLLFGATLIFADYNASNLSPLMQSGAEQIYASASQLQALLSALRARGGGRAPFRSIVVTGSRPEAGLVAEAQKHLAPHVISAYGASETGPTAHMQAGLIAAIPDAAGFLLPWVTAEIVGEDGQVLPPGEQGEIRLRAPHMVNGYLGDEAASAEAFRDGWFYPGDVGRLSVGGLLEVTGRLREVINAGGVKIAPEIIEAVLTKFPGVRDAAVFALPGSSGHEIWAAVVAESSTLAVDQLIRTCRAELGAKAPAYVLQVNAIPRTPNGKIQRTELQKTARALAAKEAGGRA